MTIGVGIIGANLERGWAHRSHIPALHSLPGFKISAVCTTQRASAEEAARRTGAVAFTDVRELVRQPDIDVVAICIKVPDHREAVLYALNAGKHVYCEWPLGASTLEAEEMARVAFAAGVVSMVGLQAQASPVFARVRELIADGYVGRILAASLTGTGVGLGGPQLPRGMGWAGDRTKGASVLTIHAAHAMDALFSCVGEPRDVFAVVRTQTLRARTEETGEEVLVTSPDQVVAGGTLVDGGAYSVLVQGGTVGEGFRMNIYGSDGMLVISTPGQAIQVHELTLEGAHAGKRLSLIDVSAPRARLPEGPAGNVAAMYERLSYAIHGRMPAVPNFDHAVKLHRFLDAIVNASDSGVRQHI